MSAWQEADISLSTGQTLHYTRTGGGGDPIVLIHGLSDNGRCWSPVARALEDRYDIIMPDMLAHGLSSRVEEFPENDPLGGPFDMAGSVAELIEKLNLKKAIVGGHSMGAVISFELTLRFPNLVRALFLEDPVWQENPRPQEEAKSMQGWIDSLEKTSEEKLLANNRRDNPHWPEDLLRAQAKSKKQLQTSAFPRISEYLFSPALRWDTQIKNIACPTLLFIGEASRGGIVSPELARRAEILNPALRTVQVPRTGHLIRFDQFPSFMQALEDFLITLT